MIIPRPHYIETPDGFGATAHAHAPWPDVDTGTVWLMAEARVRGRREAARIWRPLAIAALVVGIAIGFATGRASAETIDGAAIRVIDGDTVALPCASERGIYPGCAERIRLDAIDAPALDVIPIED